jgi:hypothetical protein
MRKRIDDEVPKWRDIVAIAGIKPVCSERHCAPRARCGVLLLVGGMSYAADRGPDPCADGDGTPTRNRRGLLMADRASKRGPGRKSP